MSVTFAKLKAYAEHAIGGTASSNNASDATTADLVNFAGAHFMSAHQWKFREKNPVGVDFRKDQDFAVLPGNFGEVIGYVMTQGLEQGLAFTTAHDMAFLRSNNVTVTQNYFYAVITFPDRASVKGEPNLPRMELWPTPSSDDDDAITLWYRSRWVDLVDDEDIPDVPDYARLAMIQTVRAVAKGWEEEDGGEMEHRLGLIEVGPVMKAARSTDGLIQSDYGRIAGGAISSYYSTYDWRSRSSTPVSGPA